MDDKDTPDAKQPRGNEAAGEDGKAAAKPQWADSLRNMYDSVVDEPIPDSFKDLLSQFDEPAKDGGAR